MKKNILTLTLFMIGGIVFGVEPNSNSTKKVEEKEMYPGIYEPFVEKVQIVNMAEVLG